MTTLEDSTLDEIKTELIERYRRTGDERINIWSGVNEEENSVEIDLHPERWDDDEVIDVNYHREEENALVTGARIVVGLVIWVMMLIVIITMTPFEWIRYKSAKMLKRGK